MGNQPTNEKSIRDEILERIVRMRDDIHRFVGSECRGRANNNDGVEDTTQSALAGIVDSVDTYREASGSLTKWSFGVASKVLLAEERARRRFEARVSTEEFDADTTPSSDLSPERIANVRGIEDKIEATLLAMPEELRSVFVLVGLLGWSHAEVAAKLGITEAAAKKRLQYARDHIIEDTGVRREDLRTVLPFLPWQENANVLRLLHWRMLVEGISRAPHSATVIVLGLCLLITLPLFTPRPSRAEFAKTHSGFVMVAVTLEAPSTVPDEPQQKHADAVKAVPAAPPVATTNAQQTPPQPAKQRSKQHTMAKLNAALDDLERPPTHGP